jgi:adenosylcobyric acid synthase
LQPTDWIILPGSKATTADLAWLRTQGLDAAVAHHAGQGGAVLGVCGGLQMLGEALVDPNDMDGNAPGLGLLPLVTVFDAMKTVRHTQTRFESWGVDSNVLSASRAAEAGARGLILSKAQKSAPGPSLNRTISQSGQQPSQMQVQPWDALAGVAVSGYEIHQGQTAQHPAMARAGDVAHAVLPGGLGWQNAAGNVLGIYLHGLFEDPAALQALLGARLNGPVPTLDAVFERMADFIETHFEPGVLDALLVQAGSYT